MSEDELYMVMGPDGLPSRPEPIRGIEAALIEKVAFIERYRKQGYYAAMRGRIPFDVLEEFVTIEPWDEAEAEPE